MVQNLASLSTIFNVQGETDPSITFIYYYLPLLSGLFQPLKWTWQILAQLGDFNQLTNGFIFTKVVKHGKAMFLKPIIDHIPNGWVMFNGDMTNDPCWKTTYFWWNGGVDGASLTKSIRSSRNICRRGCRFPNIWPQWIGTGSNHQSTKMIDACNIRSYVIWVIYVYIIICITICISLSLSIYIYIHIYIYIYGYIRVYHDISHMHLAPPRWWPTRTQGNHPGTLGICRNLS